MKNNTTIQVRVPKNLKEDINKEIGKLGISISTFARMAFIEKLIRMKEDKR